MPPRPQRLAPVADLPPVFAGIDEAGRGCLAGPVVAAAVILPQEYALPGLTDSKKLTAARRESLAEGIRSCAVTWGLGVIWPRDIDRINILQATFRAMARAVRVLRQPPPAILIDGDKTLPPHVLTSLSCDGHLPTQRAIIGGDGCIPAISAASILAKTFRDRLMDTLDRRYHGYGFAKHKGYGTAEHLAAIAAHGPCAQHRLTFRGVRPNPAAEEQLTLW